MPSKFPTVFLVFFSTLFALSTTIAAPLVAVASQAELPESQALIQRDIGRLESTSKSLSERVEKLTLKIDEADKTIQDAKTNFVIAAALLSAGIAGFISFSRYYIKKRVGAIVTQSQIDLIAAKKEFLIRVESSLNERLAQVDSDVEKAIERAVLDTESKAYLYIHIATLRYAQKYDEALGVVGWNGDTNLFTKYPEAVQRHLIACLTKAHDVRRNGDHLKAWDWVKSLVASSPSADNIEAMLRTAKELSKAADAIALYDSVCNKLNSSEQSRCEQFLIVILRKSQADSILKARLQQLAHRHRQSSDIRTQTTIAAIYRDDGLFEDADSIMRPAVRSMTGRAPRQEGWDKLFNTYIANCIDLEKPEEAIPQVKTLLASFHRPDHVFNCARVAWRLPITHIARDELFRLIRIRFDDGLMPEKDDGTIKTGALLMDLDGDHIGAETTLRRAIEDMANQGNSAWAQDQAYFYRCALAELLLHQGDRLTLERAIEVLSESVITDRNGEASYLMAKAMARKGEMEPTLRSLDAAARIKKKWIRRAKLDSSFSKLPELDSLFSKYTAPLAGG
jgi:tetratricopeptide (TPR) repeat protein